MKSILIIIIMAFSVVAQNDWQIIKQGSMIATNSSPDEVFFINENKGWLGGQKGIIYYTENSGVTWSVQRDTMKTQQTINDIFFLDENNGWACGDSGSVLYTTNGGVIWNTSSNTSTFEHLNAITFIDVNNGYSCGFDG